jgi:transposase
VTVLSANRIMPRRRPKIRLTLAMRLRRLRVAELQFLSGKSARETAAICGVSHTTILRWTREAMGFEEGAHLVALAESRARVRLAKTQEPSP